MSNQTKPLPTQQGHAKEPKLLDQLSDAIRVKHLSLSTEKSYRDWVYRYCRYHHFRHPREMGAKEITQYLTHLATEKNVAAATQNQALCAIIFFYKHVLKAEPETLDDMVWAKRPETIPVVLSKAEVLRVIEAIPDKFHQMLVQMLYGTGMRLKELIRLRIKDVDFERNQITIRRGKGDKDRMAILPTCVRERLQKQIRHAIAIHDHDLKDGKGEVYMPNALFEKYPNAAKERGWQYVFPSDKLSKDPRSNRVSRHHLFPSVLRHALKAAKQKTGILKPVYAHGLRHAFATHLLEDGHDIRTIQELLGHVSVETTMVYTHVLNSGPSGVRSPVDRLMPHASDPPPVNSPQARELAKDKQLSNSRSATDVPPLREALGIALKSLGHAIKHFFYS